MRDKVSIDRVAKLHPKIRDEVKELIEKAEAGLPAFIAIRAAQTLRTFKEQDDLYAQGRTKPGPVVTKAKAGQTYHNYGLALDFFFVVDKDGMPDWKEVVKVFEDAGYEWGGRWATIVDAPHLQKTFGLHWKELLRRHNAKDFIPGTEYVRV